MQCGVLNWILRKKKKDISGKTKTVSLMVIQHFQGLKKGSGYVGC